MDLTLCPTPIDAPLTKELARDKFSLVTAGTTVLLGGKDDPHTLYLPEIHASKWGGEAFLTLRHPDCDVDLLLIRRPIQTEVPDKAATAAAVSVVIDDRTHVISKGMDGSVEHSVVYNTKPKRPIVYRISCSANLSFHKQLPLGQSPEIAYWQTHGRIPADALITDTEVRNQAGDLLVSRREEMVNGYLILHDKKGNFRTEDGHEIVSYYDGTFLYAPRPQWTDANGDTCWCDQKYDPKAGSLTITWDERWMESAVEPVTLDPTYFGYQTLGGAGSDWSGNSFANTVAADLHTAGAGETVVKIFLGAASWDAGTQTLNVAIYKVTSGLPDTKKGTNHSISIPNQWPTAAWFNTGTISEALTSGETYCLAFGGQSNSHIQVAFNSVTGCSYDADGLPTPWTSDGVADLRFSMYAEYEVSGGGTAYTRCICDSVGLTDAQSRSAIFSRAINDAEGLTDFRARVAGHLRCLTDAEGLSDATARIATCIRSISDNEGIADAVGKATAFVRALSDSEGMLDSLVRMVEFSRSIGDVEGMTDAVSKVYNAVRSIAESVGITDLTVEILGEIVQEFLAVYYVVLRRNK